MFYNPVFQADAERRQSALAFTSATAGLWTLSGLVLASCGGGSRSTGSGRGNNNNTNNNTNSNSGAESGVAFGTAPNSLSGRDLDYEVGRDQALHIGGIAFFAVRDSNDYTGDSKSPDGEAINFNNWTFNFTRLADADATGSATVDANTRTITLTQGNAGTTAMEFNRSQSQAEFVAAWNANEDVNKYLRAEVFLNFNNTTNPMWSPGIDVANSYLPDNDADALRVRDISLPDSPASDMTVSIRNAFNTGIYAASDRAGITDTVNPMSGGDRAATMDIDESETYEWAVDQAFHLGGIAFFVRAQNNGGTPDQPGDDAPPDFSEYTFIITTDTTAGAMGRATIDTVDETITLAFGNMTGDSNNVSLDVGDTQEDIVDFFNPADRSALAADDARNRIGAEVFVEHTPKDTEGTPMAGMEPGWFEALSIADTILPHEELITNRLQYLAENSGEIRVVGFTTGARNIAPNPEIVSAGHGRAIGNTEERGNTFYTNLGGAQYARPRFTIMTDADYADEDIRYHVTFGAVTAQDADPNSIIKKSATARTDSQSIEVHSGSTTFAPDLANTPLGVDIATNGANYGELSADQIIGTLTANQIHDDPTFEFIIDRSGLAFNGLEPGGRETIIINVRVDDGVNSAEMVEFRFTLERYDPANLNTTLAGDYAPVMTPAVQDITANGGRAGTVTMSTAAGDFTRDGVIGGAIAAAGRKSRDDNTGGGFDQESSVFSVSASDLDPDTPMLRYSLAAASGEDEVTIALATPGYMESTTGGEESFWTWNVTATAARVAARHDGDATAGTVIGTITSAHINKDSLAANGGSVEFKWTPNAMASSGLTTFADFDVTITASDGRINNFANSQEQTVTLYTAPDAVVDMAVTSSNSATARVVNDLRLGGNGGFYTADEVGDNYDLEFAVESGGDITISNDGTNLELDIGATGIQYYKSGNAAVDRDAGYWLDPVTDIDLAVAATGMAVAGAPAGLPAALTGGTSKFNLYLRLNDEGDALEYFLHGTKYSADGVDHDGDTQTPNVQIDKGVRSDGVIMEEARSNYAVLMAQIDLDHNNDGTIGDVSIWQNTDLVVV